eukprot:Gb_11917 [translate_table: standard]
MELIGHRALFADFPLGTGERIVLREYGQSASKVLEEIVLALGHLFYIAFGPRVVIQLLIDDQKALVFHEIPVVVVVQLHGRASVVPHVLHCLGVWNGVWALPLHVIRVGGIQRWVHLWVQPVHQFHTVCPSHAVSPQQSNHARSVDSDGLEARKHRGDAFVVVGKVVFHHIGSALPPIPSPCFEWYKRPSQRDDSISGGQNEDVCAGHNSGALPLHSFLDGVQIPEVPKPKASVRLLLRHALPRRVQQKRCIA